LFGYALLLSCISLLKTLGTMPRSKTATLWELDCILHRATKLTDRNFTIFPPSDLEGNLLLDETIEYYKKEIIKTINEI
tara:strand:- start:65 stop:301 length:237 start_codon:yes stop_codon:yes gene_type:complete